MYPGCEQDVTVGIGPDDLPRLCGSCQRVTKAISEVEDSGTSFPLNNYLARSGSCPLILGEKSLYSTHHGSMSAIGERSAVQ